MPLVNEIWLALATYVSAAAKTKQSSSVTVWHVAEIVVPILLVTSQVWLLVRQRGLEKRLAVSNAGEDAVGYLHSVLSVFVDHPELRRYFYGSAKPPSGLDGAKVAALAEMLANSVESGRQTAVSLRVPGDILRGWEAYGLFLLRESPVIDALVDTQREWYPRYTELRKRVKPDAYRT